MGGNTMPNTARGRVTTPRPQQGLRGSQLIRPPAATLRPPQPKVNPPLAPNGQLNLNPMPAPPTMRGPGFDDTTPSIQNPNNPVMVNPLQPAPIQDPNNPIMHNPLQMAPIQNPNNPVMINPLQPAPIQNPNNPVMVNPLQQVQFDDQGNPIDNSMSMFNPGMMLKPY